MDIEFASDGRDLYLLQCRPQSFSQDAVPSAIPRDLPHERVLFAANRYVSNGRVPDITHIVYVDPEEYDQLESLTDMKDVGRAIGRLNKLLPKRQFILMGPGRWGSRGDIKLGVSVTYSDINNTAVLIEIAREEGELRPRPLVRHPLLPGPRRGRHPLPAALPGRRGPACSTSCSSDDRRTSSPNCCRNTPTSRTSCA